MLQKLTINNYALIDNLEIGFDSGLNILTGETGAGKSIILGALSLILGQRAESKYFFNQQKKCVIEGTFKISGFHLADFFEDNDLDYETETVLRREISADGKSRAFVNDTPVNLTALKQLGEKLIDIHSQHATLEINDPDFQLLVVDSVARHSDLLFDYQTKFKAYKKSLSKLNQLIAENDKGKADLDYFQFQFDELEKSALVADEQEHLERELNTLNNAEEIKRNLLGANYLLQDGEAAALTQLKEAGQALGSIEKYNPAVAELHQRINSTIIELKDIAAEIDAIEQHTFIDEARAEEVNNRLSMIYNLQKKHRVNTIAELLQIQEELSDKVQQALFGDEAIEKLQKQIAADKAELEKLATQLSVNRKKAIPDIEKQILVTLAEMGMGNSMLSIEQTPPPPPKGGATEQAPLLTATGIDNIKFLFSANKGHALAEMSKVASGGELSRLMLSIKSIVAQYTALPTIIFDEIDTGVSGEVANKVGQIMERLAQNLQVITITHLPQIASKGQSHYFVYKDDSEAATFTRIKQLSNDERVLEIAKMLSGDKPGESALQNARELLFS
ncbi:DNA repair protein RecN [Mucilaginibacter rubeus]|uniref:DNA repair protein RecN n=1 Tax=Mucilaginibacter rubeus TaxID=2027860 RepID=A0AAE6JAL6_9SPHI|nr:DNA repair protein RecN [Mucilaginibacter rubeus]QEM02011.1 DNA repair protein RecN [Mucilaginibacter rubeus]QTE42656.1 DNA repair protein RecN [Mucilaginibacter rubeus]QTE49257.1 DNA repair protein RecN [Mucilaginibacter rubeus]QTE54354.1 DNA repair protein RecN [Mucilaginibacter rubeus]QTE66192.1 DNA repair protein RecN [Mucilaginibacter rubeus]